MFDHHNYNLFMQVGDPLQEFFVFNFLIRDVHYWIPLFFQAAFAFSLVSTIEIRFLLGRSITSFPCFMQPGQILRGNSLPS